MKQTPFNEMALRVRHEGTVPISNREFDNRILATVVEVDRQRWDVAGVLRFQRLLAGASAGRAYALDELHLSVCPCSAFTENESALLSRIPSITGVVARAMEDFGETKVSVRGTGLSRFTAYACVDVSGGNFRDLVARIANGLTEVGQEVPANPFALDPHINLLRFGSANPAEISVVIDLLRDYEDYPFGDMPIRSVAFSLTDMLYSRENTRRIGRFELRGPDVATA